MTWSYFPQQGRPLDEVRLNIGDTVAMDQQLQDEEILAILAVRPNIYGAAANCCRALAAKFSRSVTQKAAGATINYSDMSKAYALRAQQFEMQAAMVGSGMPYAGGISIADKTSQEQDADRVSPQFRIGMDDNVFPVGPAGPPTVEP